MARRSTLVSYLGIYFFAAGTATRILSRLGGDPLRGVVIGLLAIFFLLLVIEPWLSRRSHYYTHLYLAVQTGIVIALASLPPKTDFFASLSVSLSLQAMVVLPPRIGLRWIAVFTVVITVLMLRILGWMEGLPLALIYSAGSFFAGSYAAFIHQAETARGESQKLLAQLQTAHQQLQTHTSQAEELAVVHERNRLARNLHDSVTQTIFTMSLTAEAARLLFDRDPTQAAPQLDKLQELAKSALTEMRALVFELRPTAVVQHGLIPALRHHLATLERQQGLLVALNVTGEPHLPAEQAQRLFRVIQEALNNVVKHAQVDQASVTLKFEDDRVFLQVKDHGRGFVPQAIKAEGRSMGLSSMHERVEMMGGVLTIDSHPGEGTRVAVEITSISGGETSD